MRTILHRIAILLFPALLGCAAVSVAFAQPALNVAATETLDIDANNDTNAQTDGMLVIRYLFGLRGTPLVEGAVGPSPGRNTGQIETYLSGLSTGVAPVLDIDDNGTADALTDGLLVLRYLYGMRGAALVQYAIGDNAQRDTTPEVEDYLSTLTASTPQPPGGCTIAAAPAATMGAPVQPGTSVQLTASCTAGVQPITFTWDGGAFTGSVRTVAPAATTAYSVVASNAAGAAAPVARTVHVWAPTNYCIGQDQVFNVDWPASGQVRPATLGFIHQIIAFRLTIPHTFSPPLNISHLGFVHITEVSGQPVTGREYTVSKNLCDFHAPPGGYLSDNLGAGETSPGFNFTVNNPTGYQAAGAQVNFQSGDVIYVNVRNFNYNNGSPTPSCPGTPEMPTCDILFDFATPNRY